MKWLNLMARYSPWKAPTLRIVNPRSGTSVIPLEKGDDYIFFQYLRYEAHALYFEGSESQLSKIIHKIKDEKGITIQKMKTSNGRGKERIVHLHLKFPDNHEVRRLIKVRPFPPEIYTLKSILS
jgi:hypothetical protein